MDSTTPSLTWTNAEKEVLVDLEPILDAYEAQWIELQKQPDHQAFLAKCDSAESRSVLAKELDLTDAYYSGRSDTDPEQTRPEKTPAEKTKLPQSIGKYQVIKHLGVGGYGVVFLALDPDSSRPVAVKVPHPSWLVDKDIRDIQREAAVLEKLRHPNIIEILDTGWHDNGCWFLVTEWIDGASLHDVVAQGPIDPDQAIKIAIGIGRGLEFGHRQGIVHRDIKPRNVMLDDQGSVKILDYGLAKILDPSDSHHTMTGTGVAKGTLNYMAPEQAEGKSDNRSDIYALALVLVEMITGSKSERGINQRLDLIRHPDLLRICRKALHPNPDKRYQQLHQFTADLEKLRDESGQSFVRAEAFDNYATTTPKLRTIGIVAASVTVLVCIAAILALSGLISPANVKPLQSNPPTRNSVAENLRRNAPGERVRLATAVSALFNEEGKIKVYLETTSPGSSVYFYPLWHTGKPEKSTEIDAGPSPVSIELDSGDYFVVVVNELGAFHEVFRRVPHLGESTQSHACVSFDLHKDGVRLEKIDTFASVATAGMKQIGDLWMDLVEAPSRTIPAGKFQWTDDERSLNDKHTYLRRFRAMDYLESVGKRLPFYHELEAGIKSGEIQDDPDVDEWTSTYAGTIVTVPSLANQLRTFNTTGLVYTKDGPVRRPEQRANELCGMRSVRSATPFTFR